MPIDDDVKFMRDLRALIDEFLVLGYAPGVPAGRVSAATEEAEMRLGPRYRELRRQISERKPRAKQLMDQANVGAVMVQYPPPAIGGPVIQQHILDVVTNSSMWKRVRKDTVLDRIDETIGALLTRTAETATPHIERVVTRGFGFIAMPMADDDPALEDVHEAIKDVAKDLVLVAERVDDPQSNRRITDRIVESLEQAEFVIVDLTHSRPTVYFEAGIAHGRGQLPIYIAREGTRIEFDLKDYPVIFFKNLPELKEKLRKRLAALKGEQCW